ncbi:DUF3570 domain-containing protein [Catenovulum maritimum]|uniref:DUF3570 domain-containing protein n=1 Tax=Catenovulum maritimum TaxID=1513271 RepID=A0A0J8GXZ5_9ALTE|nr:DUF3570 domain-containing protein [Catenovulum maritimum]KMT65598.1 hypothetical protein XM47_07825 [Catenovulum maritimum]
MNKSALKALSTAALALPGVSTQVQANDSKVGVRLHNYSEGDVAAGDVDGTTTDRYGIKVGQFMLTTSIADNLNLALSYQQETMSGASPWYTKKLSSGQVKQVMSGASIADTRKDWNAAIQYKLDNITLSTNLAQSKEDDYASTSYGLGLGYEFSDNVTSVNLAVDTSDDELNPAGTQASILSDKKESWSGFIAVSRIINKNLIAQIGVGISHKSGYLSDPYKKVNFSIANKLELAADTRPEERQAKTLATKIRYFIPKLNSALHFDYRFYQDDWEVVSHTYDLAWYQNLNYGWQIIPSIRFYAQTESFFYENYYEIKRPDNFHSTDYRLSGYGAYTLGLKLNKRFEDWLFTIGYQNYQSDSNYGFSQPNEASLSLIDFQLFSLGFDYSF